MSMLPYYGSFVSLSYSYHTLLGYYRFADFGIDVSCDDRCVQRPRYAVG
jgi:hypothetical protein